MRRPLILLVLVAASVAYAQKAYVPSAGKWERKSPAELGLDPDKLKAAVQYALENGSTWDFDRDQVRTFGAVLGPLPKQRAATNGILIRHGYIAAEFGDIHTNDPVYSVAKSFISTVCSLAVERGLIKDINHPVAQYIHDGGYDSPHNVKITWKNHLQQESEWEGTLWGKNADFVGVEQFGNGQRKPRDIHEPGTFYEYNDVRINRFALSLLRIFGKGLPEILKTAIMDPIGGIAGLALARLRQFERGDRRKADRVGQRRHALGWRPLDEFRGPRPLRPADPESRQVGRTPDRPRRLVEGCRRSRASTARTTATCGG